jgi:hypothetical protein
MAPRYVGSFNFSPAGFARADWRLSRTKQKAFGDSVEIHGLHESIDVAGGLL